MLRVLLLSWLLCLWACGSDESQGKWGAACQTNEDCDSGLVCGTAKTCIEEGGPTGCLVDEQCTGGLKCIDGFCAGEPIPECTKDSECGADKECKDSKCVALPPEPECAKDEECDEGYICSEAGKCVEDPDLPKPECETDEQCESGVCDQGLGKCVEAPKDCEADKDCDDEDACTEDSCKDGKCKNDHVVGDGCCVEAKECEHFGDPCYDVECTEQHCVAEQKENCCETDLECDDGIALTTDDCVDNQCVNKGPSCTFDADCNDGNPCTIDSCKAGNCAFVETADPLCCVTDEDCDDGKADTTDVCVANSCVFKPKGDCQTKEDCIDSNVCTSEDCDQGACIYSPIDLPECHCVTDKECAGKGNACAPFQLSANSVVTLCTNEQGPRLGGETCDKDEQCKSGLCMDLDNQEQICFGGCESDLDCKGASKCGKINFVLADESQISFPACIIPPDECGGNVDCLGGDICLPFNDPDHPNIIVTKCGPVQGGPKKAGQICADDSECESKICFDLIEKGIHICWAPCQVDADCDPGLYCYPNLIFFIFDQDTPVKTDDKLYSVPMCAPKLGSFNACTADAQCPPGEYCEMYKNKVGSALEPKCVTNHGASQAGANCSVNNQCKSNWCHEQTFCIGMCSGNNECAGGTTCQQIDLTINDWDDADPGNDTVVPVKLCVP